MPTVIRSYFDEGMFIDLGALPCPRCRNRQPVIESHPATGQMVTCTKCGARGYLADWNDNGEFYLEKTKGKSCFHPVGVKVFKRPKSDIIEIVYKSPKSKAEGSRG